VSIDNDNHATWIHIQSSTHGLQNMLFEGLPKKETSKKKHVLFFPTRLLVKDYEKHREKLY
jgi:hypothetical protein